MRNHDIIVLLINFFFVSLRCAMGQTVDRLTVDESVSMGLAHNFQLRAAQADTEEATAAYQRARAERLPILQGEASYMRLSGNIPNVDFTVPGMDTTFTLLPVELNRFYSELSLHQPIYSGGRRKKQIEAAAHMADAAKLREEQAQADVAFEIRRAYWNLYRATEGELAVAAALALVNEHVEEVRDRTEEGTLLRTDLLRAETRRAEVLLEQVDANNAVRLARLELNRLTGLPMDAEPQLLASTSKGAVLLEKNELMERALIERPSLHALSQQVLAQDAEIDVFKNEAIPEVNLVARYIYARPNQYFFAEQDRFRRTWEAGIAMRWNIWSGGRRASEVSQAKARHQNAEAKLADFKERLVMEVERNYLELERSEEAMEVAASNLTVADAAFHMARDQFEEGVVLSSQVLDTEYAFRMAKARYVGSVADYEIAKAAILKALGQIWDNGY